MGKYSPPTFVAPGDEAFTLSHEGGEHEAFEDLARQVADAHGIRYADSRTWHDHIELQTEHWRLQMEQLVNAYLDYRYRDTGDGLPAPEESEASTQYLMDVELVLIYHGYIGCSPVLPTVSVSLRTLASYHQIHRICPRFGIQAQCKLLCHLHDTPYCPYLNVQLTIAYDVYLDILGRVNCQIKKALGCDTDNWQMLNSCPACFYRLEDEPALDFDWLVSIDGNNSLKRWDTSIYGVSPRVDTRHARSDYWLDDDYTSVTPFWGPIRLTYFYRCLYLIGVNFLGIPTCYWDSQTWRFSRNGHAKEGKAHFPLL
ncbi:hypothetical protein EDD15DRAFT_2162612 [Pisolithus albus]|nr:hypothetical protein EDD15DRAFT_2162612 [Pisolithus albus]